MPKGIYIRQPRLKTPIYEQIMAQVIQDTTTGCWVFTGLLSIGRYGTLKDRGKTLYVHRWLYEERYGLLLPGFELDHLCKNPPCCNIEHLQIVTHRENLMRSSSPSGVHARKQVCPKCQGPYSVRVFRKKGKTMTSRICKPCLKSYERKHGQERYRRNVAILGKYWSVDWVDPRKTA